MWIFGGIVAIVVASAALVDFKNRKRRADQQAINSHAKPGESGNYMMGDNQTTHGQ
ncbi:hypothetical protein MKY84_13045 [Chryseomicrobium sp. FSL W7-1435]|uniref:hypothetical protein n=1 Tax=Chryseomicrobium sp. FSL W7-1435 TaxID=2921704 RepID=UPI00315A7503